MNDINSDCLYSNFLKYYTGNDNFDYLLNKAGFIHEPRTDQDELAINDMSLLSMPILNIPENASNLAIIVSTGSFSPIHKGHIDSLEIAKEYIENTLGYKVIQGVISLSHDNYVSFKNKGIAKLHVGIRTHKVYELITNHPWITVDRFEGELVSCPLNFSTIIERIRKYIMFHKNISNLKVFYVFGSDNAGFARSFVDNDIYEAVCVDRENGDFTEVKEELKDFKNIHFLKNYKESFSYSSTKIRNQEKSLKISTTNKQIYFIRTDDTDNDLCLLLAELIAKYVSDPVEIRFFNSNDISKKYKKSISLDKYIKGDYNLDISRLFQISCYQKKPKFLTSINKPIYEQINEIPSGDYTLFDDDSTSGFTLSHIKDILTDRKINVINTETLISSLLKSDELLYDVIDARDFDIFNKKGGLVVDVHGHFITRVPYIFPLVNLTTRANIKPEHQVGFSYEILKYHLYNNKNKKLDSDSSYLCYNNIEEFIKTYFNYLENYLKD